MTWKAFTHWVNTVLEKRAQKITSLDGDFADGITIVNFVELLCEKKLKKKYSQKPSSKINKIENTHLALEFLKENGVEPKYLTISAEDFVDGNVKLILGFLWMLFRKFRIAKMMGADNIDSTTEGLLSWVKEITKDYKGVNIRDFKNSFSDGNAFLAMVHAFDNKLFKYDEQIEEHSTQENIEAAFNMAEKNLGIPQLLDPRELMDGTIDERSVVLYVSLYFHAFVSAQEKRQIENEKRAASEKVTDLESELEVLTRKVAQKEEEYTKLRSQYEEQEKAFQALQREKELLLAEVDDLKDQYRRLKEKVDAREKLELAGLDVLRKNLLEHLHDMHVWKGYLEQDREYESEKIQMRAEGEIADRAFEDQLEYLSDALSSENKKLEELLSQRKLEEAEKAASSKTPRADEEEHAEDKPKPKKKKEKVEDGGAEKEKKPKKKTHA